jgi:hypothetical protein
LTAPLPGPAEREIQELAAQHGLWIATGSLFELQGGKTFNTASEIAPDGKVEFTAYSGPEPRKYLDSLGPLARPERGSRVGIEAAPFTEPVENDAKET